MAILGVSMNKKNTYMIVLFVDIGGIVDYHC